MTIRGVGSSRLTMNRRGAKRSDGEDAEKPESWKGDREEDLENKVETKTGQDSVGPHGAYTTSKPALRKYRHR